eukprot:TRINITY_DN6532_c0_g1_i1.p1 TRINITY_DN6532_c0_g1~~TRINITY_DN6532_c0_g1_i1.p1  ORF type:complete len:850 (+),score=111.32 TRINITY_DN6532_c0_g1_i1:122-2671(+)
MPPPAAAARRVAVLCLLAIALLMAQLLYDRIADHPPPPVHLRAASSPRHFATGGSDARRSAGTSDSSMPAHIGLKSDPSLRASEGDEWRNERLRPDYSESSSGAQDGASGSDDSGYYAAPGLDTATQKLPTPEAAGRGDLASLSTSFCYECLRAPSFTRELLHSLMSRANQTDRIARRGSGSPYAQGNAQGHSTGAKDVSLGRETAAAVTHKDAPASVWEPNAHAELGRWSEVGCQILRAVQPIDLDSDGTLHIITAQHNAPSHLFEIRASQLRPLTVPPSLTQSHMYEASDIGVSVPDFELPGIYVYGAFNPSTRGYELHFTPGGDIPLALTVTATAETEKVDASGTTTSKNAKKHTSVTQFRFTEHTREHYISVHLLAVFVHFHVEWDGVVDGSTEHEHLLHSIHIGMHRAHPASASFTLVGRDRHAILSHDFDSDGRLDIGIFRGGLMGNIGSYAYSDELLVRVGPGEWRDVVNNTRLFQKASRTNTKHIGDVNGDGHLEVWHTERGYGTKEKAPSARGIESWGQLPLSSFGIEAPHGCTTVMLADFDLDGADEMLCISADGLLVYEPRVSPQPRLLAAGSGGTVDNTWHRLSNLHSLVPGGAPAALLSGDQGYVIQHDHDMGHVVVRNAADLGLPAKFEDSWLLDADNDGCTDVYIDAEGLWIGDCAGQFTHRSPPPDITSLTTTLKQRQTGRIPPVFVDMDEDGLLDIAFSALTGGKRDGACENLFSGLNTLRGTAHAWLHVDLRGPPDAPLGHSSLVVVVLEDWSVQWHQVGPSQFSWTSDTHGRVYFGLGERRALAVLVWWHDDTVEVVVDPCSRCLLTISHKDRVYPTGEQWKLQSAPWSN